ncbi:MAG TPA: glycosyl transferase, partial [Candidatus Pacearchaeota archaeon]|nr:glycosyl transferase [Candidatus Pacearchaeota archaeon]
MIELHTFLIYITAYIGIFVATFYFINLSKYYKKEQPKEATDKTVSIIIPAYNEEKNIARTIESA